MSESFTNSSNRPLDHSVHGAMAGFLFARRDDAHQLNESSAGNSSRRERRYRQRERAADCGIPGKSTNRECHFGNEFIHSFVGNVSSGNDDHGWNVASTSIGRFADDERDGCNEFHLRAVRWDHRTGVRLHIGSGCIDGGREELANEPNRDGHRIGNGYFYGSLHLDDSFAAYGEGRWEQQRRKQRFYDCGRENPMSGQRTDWFTANGATSMFSTAQVPVPGTTIHVFLNGILLAPSDFSASGQNISLASMPASGDQVAIEYWPAPAAVPAIPAGTPGAPGALINVSELVNDPDFAQSFVILRSTGTWIKGEWTPSTTAVQAYGAISVARPRDLEMVPEGDVGHGAMVFWTQQPIYVTRVANNGKGQSSDILIWQEEQFRVLDVKQYKDYGYYRAIGTRMAAV